MNINKKNSIVFFILLVVVIFTSCGGETSGIGNSPIDINPGQPELSKEHQKPIRPETKELGDVKVGIIDTDFKKKEFRKKLKDLYGNRIEILQKTFKEGSGDDHAFIVTKVFFEQNDDLDNLKKIKVAGYTTGYLVKIEDEDGNEKDVIAVSSSPFDLKGFYKRKDITIYNLSMGVGVLITESKHIYEEALKGNLVENKLGFENIEEIKNGYDYHKLHYTNFVNRGNILVWAAGNNPEKEVETEAGLPAIIPKIEKGWIAVVGIDGETKKHYEKKEFYDNNNNKYYRFRKFNSAGISKNWTISADAFYEWELKKIELKDGTEKEALVPMVGSSFAAPRVAKALALVKQKFPWMDSNSLRQTIFTTAEDIGAPGVDEEYGWGLLDTKKALKGPAMFDRRLTDLTDKKWGRFIANIPEGSISIFENDISGDGGLKKSGKGYLVLDGKNTFSKETDIYDGVLEIKKETSSNIYVRSDGILIVADGAKVDRVLNGNKAFFGINTEVRDDLELKSKSNLYVKLNRNESPSLTVKKDLKATGADIGVFDEENYITSKEKEYTLIDVKGDIEGYKDGKLVNESSIEGTHEQRDQRENQIIAKVKRRDMNSHVKTLSSATKSDKNTSKNIEAAFRKLDTEVESGKESNISKEFIKGAIKLQSMGEASYLDATKTLSGEIYASSQVLPFIQSSIVNKALTDRMNEVSKNKYENYGTNSWASYISSNTSIKQTGFATGEISLNGFQVGIDNIFGEDIVLGLSFNKTKLKANFDKFAGKSEGSGFGVSTYGRYEIVDSNYLQGRIGIDRISYEVERKVLDTESKISRKDRVFSLYGEGGHDFKIEMATITPYVGFGYSNINRGEFKEKNSEWGLSSKSKIYSKSSLTFGLRGNYEFVSGKGLKTNLSANISHSINLGSNDLSSKAEYFGLEGVEIDIKGIDLAKHTTWLGVGASTEFTEQFGIQANYNAKFEDGSFNGNVISVGVNYRF